jgi:hypothetical protein
MMCSVVVMSVADSYPLCGCIEFISIKLLDGKLHCTDSLLTPKPL